MHTLEKMKTEKKKMATIEKISFDELKDKVK